MKQIEPIVFPLNLGTATILNAYCIQDNLSTSASFYYALLSETQTKLSDGNLTMTGNDYTAYETNLYAWDWIANQINVTITGDYVAPVPVVKEANAQPTDSILSDLRKDAPIDNLEVPSK
jgi:hypothetical protein